jgi:hypothetical protein
MATTPPSRAPLADLLRWIEAELAEVGAPHQFVGGLAARAHGASRPLVDIDLYVPDYALETLSNRWEAILTRPPRHHRDEHWDLSFLQLERDGWTVEVGGGDSARFFDSRADRWRGAGIDYGRGRELQVAGITIPVMPLDQLMDYKWALDRDVDREDLAELTPPEFRA